MSQESATRTVGRQEGPGAYRSRRTRPGPQAAQGPGGLDRVALALGGLTKDWRFDRMSTVVSPSTGKVSASFAAVAKHYGVTVKPCPPRRGNRKGVVEKANHVAAQRFWRTLPDDVTVEEAQARLERWCSIRGDTRLRPTKDGRGTVASLARAEPLRPVPAEPFPALLTVQRRVSAQALVAFRGNRYSVPPQLHGTTVSVSVRLGATHLDIATAPGPGRGSALPTVLARHRLAPPGAGAVVRDDGHVSALTEAAVAAFTTQAPHRNKERRPPSPAARAEAARLRHETPGLTSTEDQGRVIDLARYAAAANGRNTLTPPPATPTPARRRITKDHNTIHHSAVAAAIEPSAGVAVPAAPRPPRGPEAARRRGAPARRPGRRPRRGPVPDRRPRTTPCHRGRRHRGPPPGRTAPVRLTADPGHPRRSDGSRQW